MTAQPTGTVTFLFTDIEGSTCRWEADRAAEDWSAIGEAFAELRAPGRGGPRSVQDFLGARAPARPWPLPPS